MPILKDDAQVLQVYEQGNTSLVIVFYGRALGQFRVHGKGARRWTKKGFEGGFDLLARGEVLVYPRRGEGLWILKEWNETARPAVGQSLALLRAASYLCELTAALTRPTAGSVCETSYLTVARRGKRGRALSAVGRRGGGVGRGQRTRRGVAGLHLGGAGQRRPAAAIGALRRVPPRLLNATRNVYG